MYFCCFVLIVKVFQYIFDLLKGFSIAEDRLIAMMLTERVTGLSGAKLLVDDSSPTDSQKLQIDFFVKQLITGRPIQYVLGEATFCGLPFLLDERVLIPRPETKELIDWILEESSGIKNLLDIGTGSGCIAVSLAKRLPDCSVSAFDNSKEALSVAKKNAKKNHVAISFSEIDILACPIRNETFDVIVSNPPYVMDSERVAMERNVLDFEPESALFVPDMSPLMFYEAIALFSFRSLNPNGALYVEINCRFGEKTCELFRKVGFSRIELRKDSFGNDRMIKATF